MNFFELDPRSETKHMSKDMEQKVEIVCALMHGSQILILDEPTVALTPCAGNVYRAYQERAESGQDDTDVEPMFPEVEKTYDRVVLIDFTVYRARTKEQERFV